MTNPPKITMYSTSWCGDSHLARKFFDEFVIAYDEIDIEETPEAVKIVEEINKGRRTVPTIFVETENEKIVLVEPSWKELQQIFLVEN